MISNLDLRDTITLLTEFDGGCNYKSIIETIKMLEADIEQNNAEWNNVIEEIGKIISLYDDLSSNYNCQITYITGYGGFDFRDITIKIRKNGYEMHFFNAREDLGYEEIIKRATDSLSNDLVAILDDVNKLIG